MGSITRRDDDPIQKWGVGQWSMTVTDILEGGVDGYGQRVEHWASAVIGDLSKSSD